MDNAIKPPEPELDGYDITAVFRAIRRRGMVLLMIIITIVGLNFYVVNGKTPVFQSQSLVILTQSRTALENERDPLQNSAQIKALISTELRYLTSDNFLLDFIRKENLAQLAEYGGDPDYTPLPRPEPGPGLTLPPDATEGSVLPVLRSKIGIHQEGSSYVVSLTLQSEDPDRAAHLANSAAQLFVENASQRGTQTTRGLADRVAGQLEKQSDDLSFAISSLDTMILAILQTQQRNLPQGVLAEYQSLVSQGTVLRQVEEEALNALRKTNRDAVNARLNLLSNVERRRLNILDSKRIIWQQVLTIPVSGASKQSYGEITEVLESLTVPHATYKRLLDRLIDLELEAELFVSGARLLAPALVPQEPSLPKKKTSIILSVIMSMGLGLGVVVFLEFFTGRLLNVNQTPSEFPPVNRFELNLSRRGLRRVLRSGEGSALAETLYDVDRLILSVSGTGNTVKNSGHILHFLPHDHHTPVAGIVDVIAKRLTDLNYEVAILDLDANRMMKTGLRKRIWRSLRAQLARIPRRELRIKQHKTTKAYMHTFTPKTPADVLWVSQHKIPTLLDEVRWTYDYLLVISPFLGAHKGNIAFSEMADVNVVVSELGQSRAKQFKNLAQWMVAHSPAKPLFSLISGKA